MMLSFIDPVYLNAPDLEPVREFLQNSFKMKAKGEVSHYNHLISQLKVRDDPDTIWRVYLGLTSCVSYLVQRF
jgi:hypothetical protein